MMVSFLQALINKLDKVIFFIKKNLTSWLPIWVALIIDVSIKVNVFLIKKKLKMDV